MISITSKSLKLLKNLRKIAEKYFSYGLEIFLFLVRFTIKDLMDIFRNVLTHKLLNFVKKIITVL